MREFGKTLVTKILFWLTKFILWRFHPDIVAIAGTTNKTCVKNAILAELPKSSLIRANPKSYNTEIGLPLAVIGLNGGRSSVTRWVGVALQAILRALFLLHFPKLLILELGVDRVGDMEDLLLLVKPRALVLTSIERASSLCEDADARIIRDELATAVSRLPQNGSLVVNCDDAICMALAAASPCPVRTYGTAPEASVRVADLQESPSGIHWTLTDATTGRAHERALPKFGIHHATAAAAAFAVRDVLRSWRVLPAL